LDPTSSEAGFVLVHIAMVKESGALIKGAVEMLQACPADDRERFNEGLRTLVGGLKKVNSVMNSECIPISRCPMLTPSKQCGTEASPQGTPASVHSFLASHLNPCSPME
jgi:hypothetical protein